MSSILANTITADMGLIPGFAFVGPALGLPLSVLAGFVERPFVTLAGVKQHALCYSLQANVISLLVGIVGVFVAAGIADAFRPYDNEILFLGWPVGAVATSILVERWHLRRQSRDGVVRWRWIIAGNVLSAALCIALLSAVSCMRDEYVGLRRVMTPYVGAMTLGAALGSIVVFIAAFVIPRNGHGDREPVRSVGPSWILQREEQE